MKSAAIAVLAVLGAASGGVILAQAPDNSRSNAATENSTDPGSIADGQSNRRQDLKLTQTIRRSVMADKSLSVDAHNVKIVTLNGHVTLNGVVRSDAEKSAVVAKAVTAAGAGNVLDALKVAPRS
ncbi:MAG TPA: BON domain-containing protein [Steroidobacteraceae bacterium]|jgi:osmotically-inducible protein OsmY|nr:BON domain-containing protein [Steroidobacteraceae bacterium]